jgi:hypothetical protein
MYSWYKLRSRLGKARQDQKGRKSEIFPQFIADCGEYKITAYPSAMLQNIKNIYTNGEFPHIHLYI